MSWAPNVIPSVEVVGDAAGDEIVPMFLIEDTAGIAGVEVAEIGVGAGAASSAIVLEFADFAMVEPAVAVAEQLPEFVVAEDVDEAALANVAG